MREIKLTMMCLIYNDKKEFLVINRTKKDWPGLTFPGGHVEDNEATIEACIREVKEETGLDIFDIENVGYIEWNNEFSDNIRHFSVLFRTNKYAGEVTSSKEGKAFFIKENELKNYPLSNDFDKIFLKLTKDLKL